MGLDEIRVTFRDREKSENERGGSERGKCKGGGRDMERIK